MKLHRSCIFPNFLRGFNSKNYLARVEKSPVNQAGRFHGENMVYLYGINVCIRAPNGFSLFGFEREKIEFSRNSFKVRLGPIQGLALFQYVFDPFITGRLVLDAAIRPLLT